jgi:transposase
MSGTMPPSVCPGCRARDQRIDRLEQALAAQQQEIDRLRQQLDQLQRAGKRQAAPFRRREPSPTPKPPGRPKGHARASRPVPERVERVVDVPCDRCPDCDRPLADPVVHAQYQTDLPPVVPVVTRFDVHGGTCPDCGRFHQGRHPEMTSDATGAAANQIGPVALTMAAELKHHFGVSYRKVTAFFATYFGLAVNHSTLVRAEQRLLRKARPTFDLLVEALRQCGIVHGDETGWRIGRLNAWLWVFSSATVTVYAIRTSRGHEVAEEVLGADFDGVLVVDGWSAYDVLGCRKGRCHAHLLRRCRDLQEQGVKRSDARHLDALVELLRRAQALAQEHATLAEATYGQRVEDWEMAWIAWHRRTRQAGPEVQKVRRHLYDHLDDFMRCLLTPGVPATNNHAERMVRPAVVLRKAGGCNKTLLGACVHGVLASLMASVRQQGKQFLELALQLWRQPAPQAVPLEAWPGGAGDGPASPRAGQAARAVPALKPSG